MNRTLQIPNFANADAFVASFNLSGSGVQEQPPTPTLVKRPAQAVVNSSALLTITVPPDWDGPSNQLRRVLFSTAYQGQLPLLPAPEVNSSYNLQFYGPCVQCAPVSKDSDVLDEMIEGLWDYQYFYASWASSVGDLVNSTFGNGGAGRQPSYISANLTRPVGLIVANNNGGGSMSWADRAVADQTTASILNCTLFNATYSVRFAFEGGRQNVVVDSLDVENAIWHTNRSATSNGAYSSFGNGTPEVQSYLGLMQTMGELLTGLLYQKSMTRDTSLNKTALTRVLQTELAFTKELYPTYATYAKVPSEPNTWPSQLPSLQQSLESLFQNMTLSIFSLPSLLTSRTGQTLVEVSHTYIVYEYKSMRLWLAYGLAIAAAFLAVATGLCSVLSTGFSYSNTFSTTVRVSKDQALNTSIHSRDTLGQDPLPKHLEKAKFMLDMSCAKGESAQEEMKSLRSVDMSESDTAFEEEQRIPLQQDTRYLGSAQMRRIGRP